MDCYANLGLLTAFARIRNELGQRGAKCFGIYIEFSASTSVEEPKQISLSLKFSSCLGASYFHGACVPCGGWELSLMLLALCREEEMVHRASRSCWRAAGASSTCGQVQQRLRPQQGGRHEALLLVPT